MHDRLASLLAASQHEALADFDFFTVSEQGPVSCAGFSIVRGSHVGACSRFPVEHRIPLWTEDFGLSSSRPSGLCESFEELLTDLARILQGGRASKKWLCRKPLVAA